MAEIVNLRQARKRAARTGREELADANRIAFGLPKALKTKARSETARAEARLDGMKRGVTGEAGDER
ncbi:MAG: DUF4169 family protein [Rhizobiaceae bacterium]|nr:DUF4169 family protein [Rhizobiaceae bacterium]